MSASAITQLVSFLTRPLMRSHTPATIISLQNCLQTALSASPESTFLLSPSCPPPAPIQRACLLTGVRWADWSRLLSEGLDVQLFISEASLAVKVGTMPRRTLWFTASVAAPMKSTALALMLVPSAMPFASRLRAAATLTCTRTRRGAALHPTRIPTLLSSSWEDDADDSESDSDSDFDSDSDSDASDSGSSFTSASSVMSISSTSSPTTSPWFRCVPAPTVVCHAKADLAQYNYEGGVTRVMSGGVMLGAAPKPRPSTVVPTRQSLGKSRNAASANAAASWRKATA
ncbi:hypothetical protein C8F04DRAFT_1133878 [Mycena alexandri]|uniref:Ig-like domain-containing protein n=1 Tax=Mycena alexandri TaxID=1745969 RepID=A0AAD6SAF5_9AGAR|nr:hypothetical protein C8F04DRAFT_1133878 [Mycena alexandri]